MKTRTRSKPSRRSRRRSSRAQQLPLALVRGRGGPGRGQGRKKRNHDYVPHAARPFLDRRHPVHVSLRITGGLGSLRGRRLWTAVRRGFVFGCDRAGRFRIVHFSVQGQHIHLLCEALDQRALGRGVQGFEIRVAKAINRALARRGAVFADRYHQRIITNPTQCRHALAYVLNNQRRHAGQAYSTYPRNRVDPCSSALWFDGWKVRLPRPWANAPPTDTDGQSVVVPPRTWLLRDGWRRGGGKISPNVVPGLPAGAPPLPEW